MKYLKLAGYGLVIFVVVLTAQEVGGNVGMALGLFSLWLGWKLMMFGAENFGGPL